MKLLLIPIVAGLVSAQADSTGYFPGEPSCALPCLSSAIAAAGCQLSDLACQCGPTQTAIANNVQGCLLTSCTNPTDLGQAASAGLAVCSSFLAGELSFTQPGGPAETPTSVPGSGSGSAPTTEISTVVTTLPTHSSTHSATGGSNGTVSATPGGTHTDTLINPSTPVFTGSITSLVPVNPTGAAANPARVGAGILAGIMGAVAFL